MAETALETTAATGLFSVDAPACIACDACCVDFPEIFFMGGDDKAHTLDDQEAMLYNARSVVDTCPTGAILFSGELPPAILEVKIDEVPGWETEWSKNRFLPEDTLERDRRYGQDTGQEQGEGYVLSTLHMPTATPNVRDRYRYGAPAVMPEYNVHVYMDGTDLCLTAWVKSISSKDKTDVKETKAKIKALTHGTNSFPGRFTTRWNMTGVEVVGMKQRFRAHGLVEILTFTDSEVMEKHSWDSHFITDLCTACGICERVCPTLAITIGERFNIEPDLCINCSVCGVYCPFDAIEDSTEIIVDKIKPKKIPKAEVHNDLCTGCEFCVSVCPFDAIHMAPIDPADEGSLFPLAQSATVAVVTGKACVSCKLCEQVCIKDAIYVPRPHQFEDIGMSFMGYLTDPH